MFFLLESRAPSQQQQNVHIRTIISEVAVATAPNLTVQWEGRGEGGSRIRPLFRDPSFQQTFQGLLCLHATKAFGMCILSQQHTYTSQNDEITISPSQQIYFADLLFCGTPPLGASDI